MSTNKNVIAAILFGICGFVNAQTIDELSDLNRQAMIADAKAKLNKGNNAPVAPGVGGSPLGGTLPAGLAMPTASNSPGQSTPSAKRSDRPSRVPGLVAIYGIGGALITELSDGGFEAKYRQGDRTPTGWTVSRIESRLVSITRPKKGKRYETVMLPFGVKLDEAKESEKEVLVTRPSGMNMPPLPPSF
jgi:type IV pilus biogenesis protein PilP